MSEVFLVKSFVKEIFQKSEIIEILHVTSQQRKST